MNNLPNISTEEFFKCFADKTRLDIIRLLRQGESYVELIAAKTGLTSATVCFHLKKLEAAGLVETRREQFYIIYALKFDVLKLTLADIIDRAENTNVKTDDAADYERGVINTFIKNEHITALPVQQKKREIIIRYIANRFEIGRDYGEKEINAEISKLYDDYCTVRRELIDFMFFTRDHEIYRRIK